MQGVVQAEFSKSGVPQGVDSATIQREVAKGLENSLGGSIESRLEKVFRDSIDQGMGSRMEKTMKTGFEEMGKAMGQLMVGITRDAVGGVVRGLNQNVDQMRNELARSLEREQDLVRMLKSMQADIISVKQTLDQTSGYRANAAGPSISAPNPIPPPVSDLDVFSSHPLAHLLGDLDTNLSSNNHSGIDLDQLYRHQSPQQEQAPPALPDRSNSGTPMSMDSDILLVEPVEQKYKIPEQVIPAPRPITPVLPPTLSVT
ncbi:hypothetical protein MPER_09170 [Moniliophthora perniciosa FA553]|nr:hypothetical protein MPER_09170 [Moniliophthora perniciosa FA553]